MKLSDSSIKDCKLIINDEEPIISLIVTYNIRGSKNCTKEIKFTENDLVDMLYEVRLFSLNKAK